MTASQLKEETNNMKHKFIALIAIFIIIGASSARAEEEYDFTANDKFTRSVANIATFYLEVPASVYKATVDENPIIGLFYGLSVGAAKGVARLAVGIIELGTFPFEPYTPLMEPEFLILERKK
jgi:putative exosortase-associated protein (TIGR04073 family)